MKPLLTAALALILAHGTARAQTDARAWVERATTAYAAGELDSALAHLDQAIALAPDLAAAYKLRGDVHQRQRDFDAADEDYKRSAQIDDSDPRLFVSRSALNITEGNVTGGLRNADKAIALDPKDADAWYNRAWALYQGNDLDKALKSVRQALDLAPQFPEALYLSGVIKGEQFNEEEGVEEIAEALRLKPSIPGGLMSKAVLQYEGRHYQEAITTLTEVIASDTTELADAFYYRADCHYNLGDKDRACADWQRSMRLGDKDAAFIKKNYCDTDATKIPKKPKRKKRHSTIQF